ncbi:hypothetical protein [Nonomuraea sp. NPDC050783]|uniref:hypothetical protein n=1 Tax=Nonomuraea sp. NPDC050783 TaxID=3154634 RepID=UPI0034651222
MGGEQRKFELSGPQILGSALAAVTAAVAASYLGVAGTVIGAAVVSVASTVAGAIYTHYLKQTGEQVRRRIVVVRRPSGQGDGSGQDEGTRGAAGDTLVMPVVRERRAKLAWGKVAAAAGLVFAVSMGSILAYQAVAQETVHEQVTGKASRKDAGDGRRAPADYDGTTGGRGAPAGPTGAPRDAGTRAPATPSPTPTPTPTVTATATATATATVTVTPEPTGPGATAPQGRGPSRAPSGGPGRSPQEEPSSGAGDGDSRDGRPGHPDRTGQPADDSDWTGGAGQDTPPGR